MANYHPSSDDVLSKRITKPPLDCVQYSEGDLPKFSPLSWSMQEIRDAIPAHLFERNTLTGLWYLMRDIVLACGAFAVVFFVDRLIRSSSDIEGYELFRIPMIKVILWGAYWCIQGFIFTGIWVIGHECGHGAFSSRAWVCDSIGFVLHTLLLTPYFSWRISHHRHHMMHASMERDEPYIPKVRSDLGIPPPDSDNIDYDNYFTDTPIYTLFMLVRQQLFAFPAYLAYNVSGQKTYPRWTNHFNPNCVLFTRDQKKYVLLSDAGIILMILLLRWACSTWGPSAVIKYYGIPWLFVNHWFVMITYLQHTDPKLPHYRANQWSFPRGAAATMDRNFLGWVGRFFFHDVAHFHVAHHFFPKMPFYNGREATEHLRQFIGVHYHRSDAPVFHALWKNYNACQFVEDEGMS